MPLSDRDETTLTRGLLAQLRWRLLDKSGPMLPAEGQYYFGVYPHNRCSIGCIAHAPEREELTAGRQPLPNSMGLAFLIRAPAERALRFTVSGRFDLEHAYTPDFHQQYAALVREGGDLRTKQEVPEAYKRFTVAFEPSQFIVSLDALPASGLVPPTHDTLRPALEAHLLHAAEDPRVFRRIVGDRPSERRSIWIEWYDRITDQDSLDAVVETTLFQPHSTPLPYALELQARVRPAPSAIRTGSEHDEYLVEVFLTNKTTRELARQYRMPEHRIMDVNLRVTLQVGTHQRMRFRVAPEEYRYEPVQQIDGYGVTCALVREAPDVLRTESLPTYEQPLSETPSPHEVGMRNAPEFARLANHPLPVLDEFVTSMRAYTSEWDQAVLALEQARSPTAAHARADWQAFEDEVKRAAGGVQRLREDAVLLRAFMLMNEAMLSAISLQQKPFREWRLFQLGFVLTQLEAVSDRMRPEGAGAALQPADVLWFPTGGGKTEAYFGLIVLMLLYQRMSGRQYGVCAWLRFPLRMLSVQQFQRLAYVIGAANRVRVREQLPGFAFSVGYFTGKGTPNRISSQERHAIAHYLPNLMKRPDWIEKLRFIDRCPHCASEIRVQIAPEHFRIKHVCMNPECWSHQPVPPQRVRFEHPGEIGIFVSDEECYRYLPSVLVGTLDKVVVIGHNRNFRLFFGAEYQCPHHGFIDGPHCRHPVLTRSGEDWHEPTPCPNNTRSPVRTTRLPALTDRGFPLLIDDELHLLREDLGNFDAHYESLLDAIQCSFPGGRSPKILAATATLRDYQHHVHHLFLRPARRFPASGRDLDSSFYSRVKLDANGEPQVRRIYLGALPINSQRRQRIASWVCEAHERHHALLADTVQWLADDPHAACRALGLAPEQAADAAEYLQNFLQPSLVYARRMTDAGYVARQFQQNNEDARAAGKPDRIWARLDGHTPLATIQQVIAKIQANDPHFPIHTMVATSVVSHGVDVERLNIAFFIGWPTSTAEYIQASSRSGRVHTGIVLVALDVRNLVESTVFAHFSEYHRFIGRLVEAVPINRFAPHVLSRTLPGVFHAWVMNWARRQTWGKEIRSYARTLSSALAHPGAADELAEKVVQSYGFERAAQLGVFNARQVSEAQQQARAEANRLTSLMRRVQARYMTEYISVAIAGLYGFPPMASLRDIERQVALQPATSADVRLLEALNRHS